MFRDPIDYVEAVTMDDGGQVGPPPSPTPTPTPTPTPPPSPPMPIDP